MRETARAFLAGADPAYLAGGAVYLFHRTARLGTGSAHEEISWSLSMTEKVNQISSTPVTLWSTFMSPGVNTLTWTTIVENLSDLEATNDKLMTDNGYLMLLEQGARYASEDAINDGLMQILYADAAMDPAQPPAYVSAVDAVLAPGGYIHGIEVGIEIAQRAEAITGVPVSFCVSNTGVYGAVSWFASYNSIDHVQQANEKLNGDMTFAQFLDAETSKCYQPSATQQLYRRLA